MATTVSLNGIKEAAHKKISDLPIHADHGPPSCMLYRGGDMKAINVRSLRYDRSLIRQIGNDPTADFPFTARTLRVASNAGCSPPGLKSA